jgi:hypothetical protein
VFFDETFGGNGRSCGSCHPAANNFTIDAPFIAALHATQPLNPLFVNENPTFPLSALEEPFLLGQNALVKENVDDDFQDPLRFVGRAVNHTFSLATSITRDPNDNTTAAVVQRTGWGGDGAPGTGTLREFIDGAIKQHYPRDLRRRTNTDFRFSTNTEKDQLVAFQMALGRTADINFNNVTLTDAGAAAGRRGVKPRSLLGSLSGPLHRMSFQRRRQRACHRTESQLRHGRHGSAQYVLEPRDRRHVRRRVRRQELAGIHAHHRDGAAGRLR